MIKYEDIKDINLYENFNYFCYKQNNCSECDLSKHNLLEDAYDQPCKIIYDLLYIIKKLKTKGDK